MSGSCSHVVGLIHTVSHYQQSGLSEVPAEESATSLPQQWHKPRGKRIHPQAVSSMVMAKAKNGIKRKRRPIFAIAPSQKISPPTKEQLDSLKLAKGTPLSYLVNQSAPEVETPAGKVQLGSCLKQHLKDYKDPKQEKVQVFPCGQTSFPHNHGIQYASEDISLSNAFCPITLDESHKLEQEATRQASCDKWFSARSDRITASNFSKVFTRKKDINEKFMSSIFNQKQFTSIPTTYGKIHEVDAKAAYIAKCSSVHIHDCGLVVNPSLSFLGASPDGKVCDNNVTGLLETKCPYNGRNKHISECLSMQNFCLVETDMMIIIIKYNVSF